jgi:hypothetical protein
MLLKQVKQSRLETLFIILLPPEEEGVLRLLLLEREGQVIFREVMAVWVVQIMQQGAVVVVLPP